MTEDERALVARTFTDASRISGGEVAMSEFAKRLVIERERLGLTPTAFGSQAGVGRMQSQFEGARQPPLSYMLF